MTLTFESPEIQELVAQVQALQAAVEGMRAELLPKRLWYRRKDLAGLKNLPVSAFYQRPWLLPPNMRRQAGVEAWSYKDVFESGWIWKGDEELAAERGMKRKVS